MPIKHHHDHHHYDHRHHHHHHDDHQADLTWSSSYGLPWSGMTWRWLAVTINSATATDDHDDYDDDQHDHKDNDYHDNSDDQHDEG